MVADGRLSCIHRPQYRKLQETLFKYWDQFEKRERLTDSLLRACAQLYGNIDVNFEVVEEPGVDPEEDNE
jgi:hypothetical protein